MSPSERARVEAFAKEIRKLTIGMIAELGVGHIGGAMSIADLLAVLYDKRLKAYPEDARAADRDRLVLSKGHAGPALYAALAAKGFFPAEWLSTLNKGGTRLPSHCDRNKTPGIDMTTGSLGQGLSAACGIAMALRLDSNPATVYAIIGDGESDEGQNWEAAMFAAQKRLSSIVAFTDYNRAQIDGTTDEIIGLGGLAEKWAAFGWNALEIDGHDVGAIDAAIETAAAVGDRPTMIVLHTVKGKGCSFCEGQVGSHNMNVTKEMAAEAVAALGA
ncbi:MAG: transketolase [Spirochaetes bacterium]|nr:transketolase [Spirochaetota bacterium]MBU1082381.1 transketolase [Spirochaetota bacterium]